MLNDELNINKYKYNSLGHFLTMKELSDFVFILVWQGRLNNEKFTNHKIWHSEKKILEEWIFIYKTAIYGLSNIKFSFFDLIQIQME